MIYFTAKVAHVLLLCLKVSRVSQNVRDENKMGTPRKECPQVPAEKERPKVPSRSYNRPKCFAAL